MKKQRIQLFTVIITFLFLISLVLIQFNWIFQTAKMKQDLFNKSVNMALSSTVDNISRDHRICENVRNCFSGDSISSCCQRFDRINWRKVNKMIRDDLIECNIDLEFEFDIVDVRDNIRLCDVQHLSEQPSYFHSLEDALQESGIHLQVNFPGEREFQIAQISPMFITAIVLIILVMISLVLMLNYYVKDKKLSEKTRDFINNMTHEFKTPLANIAFANNMLAEKEGKDLSDKSQKYISIIREENKRLQLQMEELLRINELGGTDIRKDEEVCDIRDIIEEAVKSFEMQVEENNGYIKRNCLAENTKLKVNPAHLRNVIENLIDNANKYSEGKAEIEIHTINKDESLIIEVRDKGIGIRNQHKSQIFDKFYRAPTGDIANARGFGLGLTYVKMVMDAIGGKIEVDSEEGTGSVFRLIFSQKPESGI
jgi:two-component system phosphate regulon sensor histidine kinase PhoR